VKPSQKRAEQGRTNTDAWLRKPRKRRERRENAAGLAPLQSFKVQMHMATWSLGKEVTKTSLRGKEVRLQLECVGRLRAGIVQCSNSGFSIFFFLFVGHGRLRRRSRDFIRGSVLGMCVCVCVVRENS
jgi:hypothetical protein